jgi:hypothetical protein
MMGGEKKNRHCEYKAIPLLTVSSDRCKIASPKIGAGCRLKKPSRNDDSSRLRNPRNPKCQPPT